MRRTAPNSSAAPEAAWGAPIRILSGEEEARIAAEGVLAGIPDADGLGRRSRRRQPRHGDGEGRQARATRATLPFGPLRLMDLAKGSADKARNIVDEGLESFPACARWRSRSLYAVGGIWRSFARVDMESANIRSTCCTIT